MQTVRVADVALDPRSGGADAIYTYRAIPSDRPGTAVIVPLGKRSGLGFVTKVEDRAESELGFALSHLRSISQRVEGLSLPASVIELARFVSQEYLCPLPVALAAAVPPGARERLSSAWKRTSETTDLPLSAIQQEILRFIDESGGVLRDAKGKKLPAATVRALKMLRAKGVVEETVTVDAQAERLGAEPLLRVSPDEAKVDRFLSVQGRRKPAQALTLMRLQAADHAALSRGEIKGLAGVTDATLKALLDAGLLEAVSAEAKPATKPPEPNAYQRLAIDTVCEAVRERAVRPFLLFGVTGSGKTEVYMRAAAEALRLGRQVLVLVPEIALATQGIGRLRERFGSRVALLHSELPTGDRLRNWALARSGEAPVVLGARSALFAPLDNVGLIVADEEHEASYKQESAPRYHAKRLALFLGELHHCPVVFASATPSVESFFDAEEERLTLLTLPERAASARLPEVHIDDLGEGYRLGRPALLCDDLRQRLEATLERKEQAILFLNRRAYSPFVICRDCGHRCVCPNCAVTLSYHRHDRRLRCHHCGHWERTLDQCPNCHGARLSPFGVGTEKVEEAVAEMFPSTKVARLDRDVARKKGALEETLARFRSCDLDILVGTQMVAKGLDFPNVTLVGVIAADLSLNIPDFRAAERTFQLLSQVAGRAGRGAAEGHVVIQTFNPQHPAVECARDHAYVAFYEQALAERREAGYPPFQRLVNVAFSGMNRTAVIEASSEAASLLSGLEGVTILGPVDCALERLQGRWRRHILLKLPAGAAAHPVGEALAGFEPQQAQWVVDVDPHSLM